MCEKMYNFLKKKEGCDKVSEEVLAGQMLVSRSTIYRLKGNDMFQKTRHVNLHNLLRMCFFFEKSTFEDWVIFLYLCDYNLALQQNQDIVLLLNEMEKIRTVNRVEQFDLFEELLENKLR